MTTALSWLLPRPVEPVFDVGPDEPGLPGSRYEGLLRPTYEDRCAASDLVGAADSRAALLAGVVVPDAAVARLSAVWVHTGRLRPAQVALLVPPSSRCDRHSGPVHRQLVRPGDVATYGGVRVTTPLRTAVDLLCFAEGHQAALGVCALLRTGLTPDAVLSYLSQLETRAPVRRATVRLTELPCREKSHAETLIQHSS